MDTSTLSSLPCTTPSSRSSIDTCRPLSAISTNTSDLSARGGRFSGARLAFVFAWAAAFDDDAILISQLATWIRVTADMSDTTAAVAAAVAAQTPTGDGGGTAAQAYLEVYQTALAQLRTPAPTCLHGKKRTLIPSLFTDDTGAEEEDEGEDEEARAAYDKLTNEQLKQLLDEKEKVSVFFFFFFLFCTGP